MPPILTLAQFTIKGYLKERILLVVLIFGLVLMGASYVLSPLAVGAQQKIVVDIGLAAMSIFGIIIIVLLGAASFYREKEHGILKSLLVKPITRTDFVLGKYIGTVITVAMVTVFMGLICLAVMKLSGNAITPNVCWAIYLAILEVALVTAMLTMFSSFTSPILGSFFTLCVVFAGHLSKDLLSFAEKFEGAAPKLVATVAYYALPNLSLFNVRTEAVHGLPLPEGFIYAVTMYGIFYTVVILVLGTLMFRLREVH